MLPDAKAPHKPEWEQFRQRYRDPRRLRTRAAGTPFWVKAEQGSLVVTTSSGSRRVIEQRHLSACWPHLVRDEAMSRWKNLSGDNASYIGAIFDDITGATTPTSGPASPIHPTLGVSSSHSSQTSDTVNTKSMRPVDIALAIGLRDEEIADLRKEVALLRGGPGPEAAQAALRDQISHLVRELARERAEATLASTRADALAKDLAQVTAERDKMAARERRAKPLRADGESQPNEGDYRRLQRRLATAERKLADVTSALESAESDLRARRTRTTVSVELHLGDTLLMLEKTVDESVAGWLASAAQAIPANPQAAVLDCRRALEAYVALLWGRAFGNQPSQMKRGTGQLLQELRSHPHLPDSDWHLAKNLYSRASALIHEGGATSEVALWIWLGTADLVSILASSPMGGTVRS